MVTETEQNRRTCAKCGADIRENTAFCYRCGTQVQEESSPDAAAVDAPPEIEAEERTRAALDDLAARLKEDAKDDKDLAKAAGERRRARIAQRKPKAPTWEPDDGSPALGLILVSVAMLILAVFVVYFTVIAK
jgi:predicted amidophosphoribosyltransferase